MLGELGAERDERGAQAEVVERLRAQPAHEVAHLLDAGARGASSERSSARSSSGARALERLELEHDAGQRLADLVVQLARHPPPLVLLRVERAARAVAALALEPVEHVVEREAELGDLGGLALELDPLAGRERVDAAHQRGQLLERAEHAPQREQVDGQHRGDADAEHAPPRRALMRELTVAGESASTATAADEHRGVDGEDAPEQGHEIMMPQRARRRPWAALPNWQSGRPPTMRSTPRT